jgi:hypothetical protein
MMLQLEFFTAFKAKHPEAPLMSWLSTKSLEYTSLLIPYIVERAATWNK